MSGHFGDQTESTHHKTGQLEPENDCFGQLSCDFVDGYIS